LGYAKTRYSRFINHLGEFNIGGKGLGEIGFGGDAKQALQQRADFLEEQGLAQRRGQRVILARNLLGTLRNRELAQAAKDIAAETGLEHRPTADGQRVAGIYRRSVMLASGRYAMLDDGMGFMLGAMEAGDREEAGAADRRDDAWRGRVVGDWEAT
jgi:hypothetical protein